MQNNGTSASQQGELATKNPSVAPAQPAPASDDTSIRPFKFRATDDALADLKRRITSTKWPSKEPVGDATQGVQLATMQKLANYWATDYDWRKVESQLDVLPQFVNKRYVAQGGDWGALIVAMMGEQAPSGLLGIHTNMAGAVPPDIDAAALTGAPPPSGLAAEEKQAYDQLAFFYKYGLGYALEMGNRPQTLYGIDDSPIGLAAWILDHDIWSYKLIARVFGRG
jgi:Epoxide hydrolase N terminus